MALRTASGSFTRPADTTAYASGDLMSISTTAGSVDGFRINSLTQTPGGSTLVRRVRIRKTGTNITTCTIRVHLFREDPVTFANGDNGAFSSTGSADWIGSVDVTVDQAFTDGACGQVTLATPLPIRTVGNNSHIWCVCEARSAYTPASGETFTVDLVADDLP